MTKHEASKSGKGIFLQTALAGTVLIAALGAHEIGKSQEGAPGTGEARIGFITILPGVHLRSTPDLPLSDNDQVMDTNVVSHPLKNGQVIEMQNPITIASANGDVWYGGSFNGTPNELVYIDSTLLNGQTNKLGDPLVTYSLGKTVQYKTEGNHFVTIGANPEEPIGTAQILPDN